MTLRRRLFDEQLSRPCDHCGYQLVRKGSWFALMRGGYICEACGRRNPLGYDDKQKIFDSFEAARAGLGVTPKR
jgi:hypothetical protein